MDKPKNKGIKLWVEELERVINKFKKCDGVGYVVESLLLKTAEEVGLIGYGELIDIWKDTIETEVFDKEHQPDPNKNYIFLSYDGVAIRKNKKGDYFIGIEETMKNIKKLI
jgi:hypothetical protein